MAINTGSFAKALWPGINAWYGKSYNDYATEWDKIFTKESSRKAWEEFMGYSGFGLAQQKAEGAAVRYDTAQQGFVTRFTHAEYGLGFIITRNMVDDDLYDVIGKTKAQGLARSMRQTKEVVAANVLNRAFNSNYTGGDGKELLNSVHPNVAGGTYSNVIATAADISEASLEQAVIDIAGYTDDRGMKIAVKAKQIIVPYTLDFEINKIMKTEYEVGTANNTVNVIRSRFPGGVVMNHYLTDTDAWFIQTDVSHGLKLLERRGDDFTMDNDFDTENAKYKATARYSVGWVDPKCLYGSAGA